MSAAARAAMAAYAHESTTHSLSASRSAGGTSGSAGRREFDAAAAFGYASAVTTRPGLVHPEHAAHLTALPRVSVNGLWQDLCQLEVLLSGAAFALFLMRRRAAGRTGPAPLSEVERARLAALENEP